METRHDIWRFGHLEIGRKYARMFKKREDGTQEFSLDDLRNKKIDRQILARVFPLLVSMGRVPDLDQMTKEQRAAIWEFAEPWCKGLSEKDIKLFLEAMLVIEILL